MSIQMITPYIHFDGQARQVIEHYKLALGARVEALMPQNEAPGLSKAPGDRVMHSQLRIGDALLFVGDVTPGSSVAVGDNIQVALNFSDPAEMQQKYDALAEGGKAVFPIHDAFWGARFGMLTDRFGVHWMFNCEQKQA